MPEFLRRSRWSRGFTLLELLIVMAILALVLTLAWPQFSDVFTDSKKKLNDTNVKLVEQAIELYVSNENDEKGIVGILNDEHVLVKKGYLKEAPLNPENDGKYQIYKDEKGHFRVKSAGTGTIP